MDDMKLMGAVVALVAAVRSLRPKIDGLYVYLLAMVLGALLWELRALDLAGSVWAHGVFAGLAAVGGMTALDRHASASAVTTAQIITASVPPPPAPAAPAAASKVPPPPPLPKKT